MQVAGDADVRVFLEVLADTEPIHLHRDAVLREMRAGADAAAHQHNRALQRAGRDDHLAGGHAEAFAIAAGEPRRLDAAAGDVQPMQRAFGQHGQVRPAADLGWVG